MEEPRWERVKTIVDHAQRLSGQEKDTYLQTVCREHPDLCGDIEALLVSIEESEQVRFMAPVREDRKELMADLSNGLKTSSSRKELIGTTIGSYHISERLGSGGMGVVYKARDTKLGRSVALKFLPPYLAIDRQAKERFLREARTASALDHPNIAVVHEIGETERGRPFIAMSYYEGETLKEKIARGPLAVEEATDYATQIAHGLKKAHAAGILHRDIKPANVMITEDNEVKILDFGLAKLEGSTRVTKPGTRMGTAAYMSPEQARGESVDLRTDLWSLGVVLYEMLTGKRPFKGENEQAMLYSILNEKPKPINSCQPDIPEDLEQAVHYALEKDQNRRIQSAEKMLGLLKSFSGIEVASAAPDPDAGAFLQFLKRPVVFAPLILLLLLATALLMPRMLMSQREQALSLLPRIEQQARAGNYAAAYEMADQAEEHLEGDSTLARWMPVISDRLTISTQPAGVRVYLQRYTSKKKERFSDSMFVGTTPIHELRIARNDYRVWIDKKGFVPLELTISSKLKRVESRYLNIPLDLNIDARLLDAEMAPTEMVFVPGGPYRLVGAGAPTKAKVNLNDFLIDKYEVSNEEYQTFIEAGGYANKEYWKHPFVKEGRRLSRDEAMQYFTDRTGLPGPRHWIGQEYPDGKDEYPVTNISWYEAAAYAEWGGKRLPTVFEWEKAARDGKYTRLQNLVMPWGLADPEQNFGLRANFSSDGTDSVDSHPFGVSPYGAYNMAGNVKEWIMNETTGGYIYTGGSWQDPVYLFSEYGVASGFFASPALGFRTVRDGTGSIGGEEAMRIDLDQRTPTYHPVDKATFQRFLGYYEYDHRPLQAKLIGKNETADWTRLKVSYAGLNNDRVLAYLYLPKHVVAPFQCLVFVPNSGAFYEMGPREQAERLVTAHIKAGRAVFTVGMKGMIGRPWKPSRVFPDPSSVQFRELMVLHATELSRGIDYLATREDIDMDKLAYISFSWGSGSRLVFAAVEDRYSSVILVGGGIDERLQPTRPEANSINFAPYIEPPTLLLNGKYDEEHPYLTRALPLWNLLTEPKKFVLVEGGHHPPPEARVPVINEWLDKTLGPVNWK